MNRNNIIVQCLLLLLSLLYGAVARTRNWMFDYGILASVKFPVPIICVGNLSAGGTGKTPFTEYLIALLKREYRVATLSRGYKRQTTGFMLVENDSTVADAGDEACQIKRKFPDVTVAVDANRRRGIKRLLEQPEDIRPEVILLDDAMQHRFVLPSMTIMLTACDNIYYEDRLLPAGTLRESGKGVRRADVIIVTKCQKVLKPIDMRIIEKSMFLMANQNLYFSKINYQNPEALFPKATRRASTTVRKDAANDATTLSLEEFIQNRNILLIAGVAQPQLFINKISACAAKSVNTYIYPDHYDFMPSDIEQIDAQFQKMPADNRLIVCTEKDAMRLKTLEALPDAWKPYLYYVPIVSEILFEREDNLNSRIQKHVLSTINLNKKNGKN